MPCRAMASNGSQASGTSELVIGRLRPSSSLVATTTRSPLTTAPLRLVNNRRRPPGRPITVELARPTADAVGSPTLVSTPLSDPKIRPPPRRRLAPSQLPHLPSRRPTPDRLAPPPRAMDRALLPIPLFPIGAASLGPYWASQFGPKGNSGTYPFSRI
jgi:hypothetical protein